MNTQEIIKEVTRGANLAVITTKQKDWITKQAREENLVVVNNAVYFHSKFYKFLQSGPDWTIELKFIIRMSGENVPRFVDNREFYEHHRAGRYFDLLDPVTSEIQPMKYFIQIQHMPQVGPTDVNKFDSASMLFEGSVQGLRDQVKTFIQDYTAKGGQFSITVDSKTVYHTNHLIPCNKI